MNVSRRVFALLLPVWAACRTRAGVPPLEEQRAWPVAGANAQPCADVQDVRGCWSGERVTLSGRPLPARPAATPMGWRCSETAGARTCVDRAVLAPSFSCEGSRCLQAGARAPDDGEWLCGDVAGAVVCQGGAAAAGVLPRAAAAGWLCGARKGETVCVDLSPDFPEGRGEGWRCGFEAGLPLVRVCQRDPDAHNLGDACGARRPCVDGAVCAGGRCLPARPRPSCVSDDDCEGVCRFGSCIRAEQKPEAGAGCVSCAETRAPSLRDEVWVVARVPSDPRAVVATPARALRRRVVEPGYWLGAFSRAALATSGGRVRIAAPGACPIEVNEPEGVVRVGLSPWLSVQGAGPQVGFGKPAEIRVVPGCPEARAGRIEWRIVEGQGTLDVQEEGFRVRVTTPAFAGETPWGIVPLSPRTRGEVLLEARWLGSAAKPWTQRVTVAAAVRASGVPSIEEGARIYLGGRDWRVVDRPRPGIAAVLPGPAGGLASLLPDAAGTWSLVDGDGRGLDLQVGRHNRTPLDCGRSGCHAAIAEAARTTAMTAAWARLPEASACARGCHAVGEPGLTDGLTGDAWGGDLRRAEHRLAGVGCTTCHGPGAIPAPGARWSILRTDVCATCHDAPPRYGHVSAWRTSRMARSDADPRTRESGCASCHTTWGALAAAERKPPGMVGAVGLTCAACHGVHAPGGAGRLLRRIPRPALLIDAVVPPSADARAGVCLSCHTPARGHVGPSAAALWAGRGGVDPASGAPLAMTAAHSLVEGGCVGCHRGGPAGLQRGAAHAFAVDTGSCATCHGPQPFNDALSTWAQALWQRFQPDPTSGPAHTVARDLDLSTPRGRAAWNVSLVLEDRAAWAHNPAYARALLDSAARVLGP